MNPYEKGQMVKFFAGAEVLDGVFMCVDTRFQHTDEAFVDCIGGVRAVKICDMYAWPEESEGIIERIDDEISKTTDIWEQIKDAIQAESAKGEK